MTAERPYINSLQEQRITGSFVPLRMVGPDPKPELGYGTGPAPRPRIYDDPNYLRSEQGPVVVHKVVHQVAASGVTPPSERHLARLAQYRSARQVAGLAQARARAAGYFQFVAVAHMALSERMADGGVMW